MSKIRNLIILVLLLGASFLFAKYRVESGGSTEDNSGTNVVFSRGVQDDATPAVLARLMTIDINPIQEIKFEKGTYHFYPDKGLEFFAYISNHNDVLIRTAFPLVNLNNLKIDGQGSKFIFHGKMIPFLIDNSENIEIKNLSIDWEQPFHSEGLVVARDVENSTFDLQIPDRYPYEIRNGQLIFIKEYYEHGLGQAILFDAERNAISFDTESYTPLTTISWNTIEHNTKNIKYKYKVDERGLLFIDRGKQHRLRVEQIKPGLVRIYNHGKKMPEVGKVLVCKGDQSENRLAPAFRITATKGFKGTNVNVHHAGGMGLIAENSSDLILDNFNVVPSNGRLVSTTADATHFVGCRGKVVLKNCTFNNQLDDASNVHGTYQEIVEVLDEYTLGIRTGHFQQQGFVIGFAGDKIGLIRLKDSFFPYGNQTIKSVKKINARYQVISFNEKLNENIKPGDLIENLDAYPEFTVQNCNISRNRARGLLLSTPKKTVIENNFFSTEMEALLIPVESGHWYESGSSIDLTIRNNTFQDCTHSGQNRGVIRFVTDDDNENIAFKNIIIEGNEFHHFDNLILEVANTDNLVFTNNKITNSETFPQLFPENPVVRVKSSKNINFNNNIYNGKASEILESDDLSNRNVKLEFN